jgi:hypothetical protein
MAIPRKLLGKKDIAALCVTWGLWMRLSGRNMWWNVAGSGGRKKLNASSVTATNKQNDMGRHRCTRHSEIGLTAADSGTDDWEQLDPGTLSDVVGSTSQNCPTDEVCQRKPTRPAPVSAPVLKSAKIPWHHVLHLHSNILWLLGNAFQFSWMCPPHHCLVHLGRQVHRHIVI